MKKGITCKSCDNILQGKQKMYCSVRCKNKAHQSYDSQKERGLLRKLHLVQEGGGKCVKCGYSKNLSSLAFHHLDASTKKFKLDVRSLSNRKEEKIISEFKKCILVCHNCHGEIHNPTLDLALNL